MIHLSTFNINGGVMLSQIAEKVNEARGLPGASVDFEDVGPALRDLALAKTHLEDALTRYNSACYRIKGTWKRLDPDIVEVYSDTYKATEWYGKGQSK